MSSRWRRFAPMMVGFGFLACHGAGPQRVDGKQSPNVAAAPRHSGSRANAASSYFTDVELITHEGETKRLYSDLLQDHVVVVSSFFTRCHSSCPVTMATLRHIQNWLGDRLGSEVYILSLTVDPATDTPRRLAHFARQLDIRPGWYLLTGTPTNVETALRKLGQYADKPQDHSPLFIVGNEATGLWKKAFGLAPAHQLVGVVESVLRDRL